MSYVLIAGFEFLGLVFAHDLLRSQIDDDVGCRIMLDDDDDDDGIEDGGETNSLRI